MVTATRTNWNLIGGLLAVLTASLAIGAIVAGQAAGQARIEQDLKDLRLDVGELKADVKTIRMRTVGADPIAPTPILDTIENEPAGPVYANMNARAIQHRR